MPSSVRLSKRNTQKDIQDAVVPENKGRNAVTPEQALYGIFGPQLAATLAASANGAQGQTAKFADRIILKRGAQEEAERYSRDLAASNEAQQKLQEMEQQYGILNKRIDKLPSYTEQGIGEVLTGDIPGYGVFGTPTSGAVVQRADNAVLNQMEADRVNTKASGYGVLAEKTGIRPTAEYLGKDFTNPNSDPNEGPVQMETFHPYSQETARYGTDEGLTFEQQKEIEQLKATARKNGDEDEIEVSVKQGEGGVADVTYKGSPDALVRNGIDPTTGKKLSPNSGAEGGAAPTKPAAELRHPVDLQQASVVGSEFGRVTSTKRDPKHNKAVGGVKNSYHLSGQAIDIARAKGVTHKQIEQAYKNRGWKIIESLDEGDHSHLAFSEGPPRDTSALYATRFKQNPNVANATPIGDGSVVVELKDGSKRVYKNGRRVG